MEKNHEKALYLFPEIILQIITFIYGEIKFQLKKNHNIKVNKFPAK